MSLNTLTLLTQGLIWDTYRPKTFMCIFTEDDTIAYIDFISNDFTDGPMQRLRNVQSGITYQVRLPHKLDRIFFVPDDVSVEKHLRITDIQFDADYVFNETDSSKVYYEDGSLVTDGRPNGAIILARTAVPYEILPPHEVSYSVSTNEYVHPPYPFTSETCMIQRASDIPTSIYTAVSKHQAGLPFETKA